MRYEKISFPQFPGDARLPRDIRYRWDNLHVGSVSCHRLDSLNTSNDLQIKKTLAKVSPAMVVQRSYHSIAPLVQFILFSLSLV